MRAAFSRRFIRHYTALSEEHKAKFDKQLGFLLTNLRHPSLRAKKYDEARDIWQARLDEGDCSPTIIRNSYKHLL